ncbi:hypothetical protein QWY99_18750 [Flavobacterium branchiarum]|uniref:Uncharacterized protein n=1 Tax=Flavobacterium branchiarum TaxID=1114870 RepID=A0ABV5FIP7_9FLAO|nr:hypothetical protein [Flavobacterium branchiarum]MDN3675078.1 hypothetical protein [Flavobacterium branchiarum]
MRFSSIGTRSPGGGGGGLRGDGGVVLARPQIGPNKTSTAIKNFCRLLFIINFNY